MTRKDFIFWDRTMHSYGMWLRDGRSIPGNRLGYPGNCQFDGMPISIADHAKIPTRFRIEPAFEQIHRKVLILDKPDKVFIDRKWLRGMSIRLIADLMESSTRTAYRKAGSILEHISNH